MALAVCALCLALVLLPVAPNLGLGGGLGAPAWLPSGLRKLYGSLLFDADPVWQPPAAATNAAAAASDDSSGSPSSVGTGGTALAPTLTTHLEWLRQNGMQLAAELVLAPASAQSANAAPPARLDSTLPPPALHLAVARDAQLGDGARLLVLPSATIFSERQLMKIPAAAQVAARLAKVSPMLQSTLHGSFVLAVAALHERRRGANSPWQPFLGLIADSHHCLSPLCWTPGERLGIANTTFDAHTRAVERRYRHDFELLFLDDEEGLYKTHGALFEVRGREGGPYGWEALRRELAVQRPHLHPSLSTLDPTVSAEASATAEAHGSVLVPLLHWLPHRNWRNEEELRRAGERPGALRRRRMAVARTPAGLEFRTRRALTGGQRVALTDASTSALSQRAVERGSILARGPHFIYLRIPAPETLNQSHPRCFAEAFLQTKLKLLTKYHLPTWVNFVPAYSDGLWPAELVTSLRVLLALPDEEAQLQDAAEGRPISAANDASVSRVLNAMVTARVGRAARAPASRPEWTPGRDASPAWPARQQLWLAIKAQEDRLVALLQAQLPIAGVSFTDTLDSIRRKMRAANEQ